MRGRRQGLGSYTLGDRYVTPDRRLSQMLMRQGSRGGPSNSWQETLGRIAQQLSGAYIGKLDQDKQDLANQAFTKVEPNSYSMQPTMNDQQIMESDSVQNILRQNTDADRMKNPMIQRNMNAIGYEQKALNQDEARLNSLDPNNFMTPDAYNTEVKTLKDAMGRATQNIENYGDEFNQTMGRLNLQEPTDDQRADAVRQELIGQRKASEVNTLNEKKPQLEYAMQNLRGLENNPYAQRLLQGLMMNKMDTDAASRLAQTAREQKLADDARDRGYTVEDATTDFGRKKELANIAIEGKKTKEQRNWEMAQDDPKFSAFLSATGAGNTPNAVKEYQYYMGLKTELERQNFMNIKRATKTVNLGDTVQVLDQTNPSGPPLTSYAKGVPPQQTPEHKASVKESETTAKSVAEARFNLPKIISTADRHLALLDRVTKTDPETGKRINHPGFKSLYGTAIPGIDGATAPFARFMPGSDTKDLSAIVEQIGGSNFLLAFESLKGGGQITENEGNQAKLAISALQDINISEQEAFRQYDTLRTILAKGVENAKTEAGQYDMQLTNTGNTGNQSRRSTDKQERRSTDIPEGVSKEQWGVMSPEQKALFK
jgi:hypothetical protein